MENRPGTLAKKNGDTKIPTEKALLTTARAAVLSFDPTASTVSSRIRAISKPSPNPVHNKPNNAMTLFLVNVISRNPTAQISRLVGTIHFFNFMYTCEKANPLMAEPNVETDKPKVAT